MRTNHKQNDIQPPRELVMDQDDRLLLEDIFNTAEPAVQKYFSQIFRDEVALAEERALLRVGMKFKHLLPPQQQEMLDRTVANLGDAALSALKR